MGAVLDPSRVQGVSLGLLAEPCRISLDDDDMGVSQMAMAAALEAEAHCSLALLSQQIEVTLDRWTQRISLPIGPLYAAGLTANPITVEALADDGTASEVTGFYTLPGRYGAGDLRARLHLLGEGFW
ncbi:hypothetical protein ACFOMH_10650 [Paracoccus mangrovi]|uniref:Uncharacterized protein n=1 Tax=Paracoccus mangrovi TaxID=1715645 RepID=A0ABV7R5U2_9RHOB